MSSSSNNKEMVVISSDEEEEEDEENHTIFSSSEDEPEEDPNSIFTKAITLNKKMDIEAQQSAQTVNLEKKRLSGETSTSTEDSRKQRRVFTEDDEILLLQRMIDLKYVSGKVEGLYESIKKSVRFEMTKRQLSSKIWHLKKKYISMVKNGGETSFMRVHDRKCLEMCKRIWGTKKKKLDSSKQVLLQGKKVEESSSKVLSRDGVDVDSLKSNWFEESFLVQAIGLDERLVKQRWRNVSIETKKEIEEDLKLLQAKEIECALQKKNLEHKVTSVIRDAIASD